MRRLYPSAYIHMYMCININCRDGELNCLPDKVIPNALIAADWHWNGMELKIKIKIAIGIQADQMEDQRRVIKFVLNGRADVRQ